MAVTSVVWFGPAETAFPPARSALISIWQVADADQGAGTASFSEKGSLWEKRRGLVKYFWSDLGG